MFAFNWEKRLKWIWNSRKLSFNCFWKIVIMALNVTKQSVKGFDWKIAGKSRTTSKNSLIWLDWNSSVIKVISNSQRNRDVRTYLDTVQDYLPFNWNTICVIVSMNMKLNELLIIIYSQKKVFYFSQKAFLAEELKLRQLKIILIKEKSS